MLEVAESDFTRLLAEAEAGEKASQSSYDKLKQENAVARAANTEEVKGKESEVKRVEGARRGAQVFGRAQASVRSQGYVVRRAQGGPRGGDQRAEGSPGDPRRLGDS